MGNHFGFPTEAVVIFLLAIAVSVYFDLFSHKEDKEISVKDASIWSIFWVGLALAFYAYLYVRYDAHWANMYLSGYVLEKTLSIDNLMVFIAIFASFGIKSHLQHRILYWGIIGALVFRAIFVVIGTSLFNASPYVGFIFAAFIIWSGYKMFTSKGEEEEITDYSQHWSVRLVGKYIKIYPKLVGEKFFTKIKENHPAGVMAGVYATPAFLCLLAIETSDIAFAFDSVPAVIAVTQEPLLVYAAMIFAVLGLRSLYFVLAALTKYLVHLEKAVIILLFYIGFKMILQSANSIWNTGIYIDHTLSILIVLGTLAAGVIASFVFPQKSN